MAGKGHEQVLVTNFGKIPWDERTVLEEERARVHKGDMKSEDLPTQLDESK
ncbi:MAG: hypothetical protein Q8O99_04560 [bacterium]|nr:hypothetical protein [bacterium]